MCLAWGCPGYCAQGDEMCSEHEGNVELIHNSTGAQVTTQSGICINPTRRGKVVGCLGV